MKINLFVLLAGLSLTVASCKKQPIACILTEKKSVDINEPINFESCASDADGIAWDFGDGTTADGKTASHSWSAPGTYIVQMRATSKGGKKADRYSVAITVKGYTRYVTKVVLKGFAAKKPDNTDWDGSGVIAGGPAPDVYFKLAAADGSGDYTSSTKSNITTNDLPFTWNVTQQNIYLSNQNWTIELRDDDSFGSSFVSELMTTFTSNLATTGSNGVVSLSNTQYSLDIYYENRQ